MLSIYERAVISAFQNQVDQGIEQPTAQLKTIERRMRALSRENEPEAPNLERLIGVLVQGLCVQIGSTEYMAQLEELQTEPRGGLVKQLSAKVDKRTRNPKTSRGTVWKRNSTVKERRRMSAEWRTGAQAKTESKRKSTVRLTSYSTWLRQEQQRVQDERRQKIEVILGKKEKRSYKKAFEVEMKRRMEADQTPEQKVASALIEKVKSLAERKGITDEAKLFRCVLSSLEKGQKVPLLFVWGPPYEGQGTNRTLFSSDTPEKNMADEIEFFIGELEKTGVAVQPILLFADVYGLEINGMPWDEVQAYFYSLQSRFSDTTIVVPWSEVRDENRELYETIDRGLPDQEPSQEATANAVIMQEKLGRTTAAAEAQKLAKKYQRERTIEGVVLRSGFYCRGQRFENVIKLGTAPNRFKNDEPYETGLPRIYIKNMTRAAWNKPRRKND